MLLNITQLSATWMAPSFSCLLRTCHYLSPGGRRGVGGVKDFGLNKVKFSQSPPLNVTSLKWSPLITFDGFRDPPPMSSFSSKFEWSPLWIIQKFSVIPLFGFSVTSDPPFVLLKIKLLPPKSIPPPSPHQAINNDRSLTVNYSTRAKKGVNSDLQRIRNWCFDSCLMLNPDNTKLTTFKKGFSSASIL